MDFKPLRYLLEEYHNAKDLKFKMIFLALTFLVFFRKTNNSEMNYTDRLLLENSKLKIG